jgi:hypothetical protein
MAIPETNVTTTLAKNALGAPNNDVKTLCTYSTINVFSRQKPVQRHNVTPSNWYKEINGDYSLFFPETTLGTYTIGTWDYKPCIDSYGYRLGDFRGYNHTAIAPYYMDSWQTASTNTTAGFEIAINSTAADGITNADIKASLGWSNVYFGIRLVCGGTTVYKNQLAGDSGFGIGFTVTDSVFNGYTGTCTWSGFISENSVPLTNSLTGAQQAYNIVILPSTRGYTNSGSFTITAPPPPPVVAFELGEPSTIDSINGTIAEGSDIVYYTVVNSSGSSVDLELELYVGVSYIGTYYQTAGTGTNNYNIDTNRIASDGDTYAFDVTEV